MKYVIIGHSTASVGAVEGIRQVDQEGSIVIVSKEPYPVYSRPLISYLLQGKIDEEKMSYRNDRFYRESACQVLYGATATGICRDEHQVILDDGRVLSYDKVLIATGSAPFIPPVPGLDTVRDKGTFMSLDDARHLDALVNKDKQVLIIGAGLIGLKCAEGLQHKARGIHVVDLAPRILSSILDEEGAGLVQSHLESQGIAFRLGTVVKQLKPRLAMLENGESIPFDVLVIASGVRPNTRLLAGIAEIDKGIVINERSETTAESIYAAGDCTQAFDISSGQNHPMPLMPNAYLQGECAGVNMAGGNKRFNQAIPMNAISFFGLHVLTAGSYHGKIYAKTEKGKYKRLFYDNQKLNGYILIGSVDKAGIYTSMIREQTPIDSIDFPLICEMPGLIGFSRANRKQKLGGVPR